MPPIAVPPELRPRPRPRGPRCVRGPSPESPPTAAAIENYSSISEEGESVAARVKKRLQRVSKVFYERGGILD